ncbi:unnamed protein product, partial [Mesorhabditis belari]|uniref:Uncharacterized protein n=1 Tax=Mesorhabditis belari TaxID=2138241 RepID=A0AAF3F9E9_9BILA
MRTRHLKDQNEQSRRTVEMQNYFLLIYLLQMFNTFFTFLLPCFMLILALLNISILPEFVSSSFVLFMYFHSAFNSLILIFSTRTYRQVLYGWWLKVYSFVSRKAIRFSLSRQARMAIERRDHKIMKKLVKLDVELK